MTKHPSVRPVNGFSYFKLSSETASTRAELLAADKPIVCWVKDEPDVSSPLFVLAPMFRRFASGHQH